MHLWSQWLGIILILWGCGLKAGGWPRRAAGEGLVTVTGVGGSSAHDDAPGCGCAGEVGELRVNPGH